MAAVLALITEVYQIGIYPAMSYLSSQLFVPAMQPDLVAALSKWQERDRSSAWRRCEGMVRIACLCGSCSWHLPTSWLADAALAPPASISDAAWQDPQIRAVSCSCNARSPSALCPSRGCCESYICWLQARFGVSVPAIQWLWLPEGSEDYSDGRTRGVLSKGLAAQAEPVAESHQAANVKSQRYRCSSCQVLTHAEVTDTSSGSRPRLAIVVSYEQLRWSAVPDRQERKDERQADFIGSRRSSGSGSSGSSSLVSRAPMILGGMGSHTRRPPLRLHDTWLEEVLLPLVQPHAKDLLETCFSRAR